MLFLMMMTTVRRWWSVFILLQSSFGSSSEWVANNFAKIIQLTPGSSAGLGQEGCLVWCVDKKGLTKNNNHDDGEELIMDAIYFPVHRLQWIAEDGFAGDTRLEIFDDDLSRVFVECWMNFKSFFFQHFKTRPKSTTSLRNQMCSLMNETSRNWMFNFTSVVQLVLSFKGVNKTIILDRKKEVSRRKQEETLTPACLDFVVSSRAGWESQAVGLVSFKFFFL